MSIGPLHFAKCNASQLKLLAELTGLNTTGTKSMLYEALTSAFSQPVRLVPGLGPTTSRSSATRILSIDMGIRNLAYAVIQVREDAAEQLLNLPRMSNMPLPSMLNNTEITAQMPSILNYITLLVWKRTSLYDALKTSENLETKESSPELDELNNITKIPVKDTTTLPKEAFDPATFASLAYNLVKNVFLPYNVSHVLIERQRYRTGGASAIMEWTVRVNMLESMLHAVFRTLRNEQQAMLSHQNSEHASSAATASTPEIPQVHSVSPQRVGRFWHRVMPPTANTTGSLITDERTPGETSKVEKEAKIAIATSFLAGHTDNDSRLTPLDCQTEAETTKNAFLAARNRKTDRKNKENVRNQSSETKLGNATAASSTPGKANGSAKNVNVKLDDLADCLLQGTAWLQWELNRLVLREWVSATESPDISNSSSTKSTKRSATRRKQRVRVHE